MLLQTDLKYNIAAMVSILKFVSSQYPWRVVHVLQQTLHYCTWHDLYMCIALNKKKKKKD